MINLEIINASEQQGVLESFWTMLQECESKAMNENCVILRHWVDEWYKQWNRVTGDNKVARWHQIEE